MLDQYRRGVRTAVAHSQLWGGSFGWTVAKDSIRSLPRHLRYVWFGVDAAHRVWLAAAYLLVPPAVLMYVWGALSTEPRFARLTRRRDAGAQAASERTV